MCPLRTILIDLDDTLFDHTHSVEAGLHAVREYLPALHTVEPEILMRSYNRWLDVYTTQLLAGELTPDEERVRRFERVLYSTGIPTAEVDLPTIVSVYRQAYGKAERAVPGAAEMLAAFVERDLPICVVTDNPHKEQVSLLERIALWDYVTDVVTPEQTGSPKPDALIFRRALTQMEAEAAGAVMIGDSWSQDVLGARRVGIRAVWLNRQHYPHPEPGRTPALTSLRPLDRVLSIVIAGHLSKN